MANQEHLELLKQGRNTWNAWRNKHPEIRPDLSLANLSGVDLNGTIFSGADLAKANLSKANLMLAILSGADLFMANLSEAKLLMTNLSGANLSYASLYRASLYGAILSGANLSGANLTQASLIEATLTKANLSDANLSGANLKQSIFVRTNLTRANLNGCSIYGIAAWDVQLEATKQLNLVITPDEEPVITVDNLKIAQFIYLLLNNQEIRDVINTITSKVVLILGSFTPERKAILDALRNELRNHDYLPVVFDFEQPSRRNLTETVSTLAHMARFIIADLTSARSVPQELERIVPRLRVPIQSLLQTSEEHPYTMFESFADYPWVLPLYRYTDQGVLIQTLQEHIITPAEQKAQFYEMRRQEAN